MRIGKIGLFKYTAECSVDLQYIKVLYRIQFSVKYTTKYNKVLSTFHYTVKSAVYSTL